MTNPTIMQMARDAGSIDSDETIEALYKAFSGFARELCIEECRSLVELGPVSEVQNRYNEAYMQCIRELQTGEFRDE